MDFGGAGADVIGEGQRATPFFRSDRPGERGQKWQSVTPRNREHGNLCNRFGFADGKTLGIRSCPDTGSERIAGIIGVHYAAALDAIFGTPAALGIVVTLKVAVISGVGIDDASDGAGLAANFRFDATPAFAIAATRERAF